MNVRAKFRCTTIAHDENGGEVVQLHAAYGPENEPWSKFTPSGHLQMRIDQTGATGQFKPGKHYFLTFTEAE